MSGETSGFDLSPEQTRALAAVLDQIIPASPERRLPAAGELGLVAALEARAPELRPAIVEALAALDALAQDRGAERFPALPAAERTAVMNEVAATQPAFLPGLILQTFASYYQDPRVARALGLEARAPYPLGYTLEPSDLGALLTDVRRRPVLYRE